MPQTQGRFIIDDSVSEKDRKAIIDRRFSDLEKMNTEVAERSLIIEKRKDFYEGRHHKWTNVVGQVVKQSEGHILATFNYVLRFCQKLHQTLTNTPPRMKIVPKDESNDIETSRAEAVEQAILDIFKKNYFFNVVFRRAADNQVRDGDFVLDCRVVKGKDGKKITISPMEDLTKVKVFWDDASGSSFSAIAFEDDWSLEKIKREFGYDAEAMQENIAQSTSKGDHVKDQYGMFAGGGSSAVPSGQTQLPKAKIRDLWSLEVIKGEVRVCNIVYIGKEAVQFVVTDYKEIPKLIGHSLVMSGKPWSMSFIDPLIDPQVELNDRTSEEGDLIRMGSHMKFLAVNMSDFDPSTVRPGSGQVIFIEGENADFRPLQMNITPFPSADYINRVMEHMFTLGIPKIALAAGTAPYTGKVGAIQYQPFADLIATYRIQWEVVFQQLITMIQEYLIAYFPETHQFMRESMYNETTGEYTDGELIVRDVEFDWENVLPLSRSDRVVDASNLRDRSAISLHTYLGEAGFRDPSSEIKKLKKEARDTELMAILPKFNQFTQGAVQATLAAQQKMAQAEEDQAEAMGMTADAAGAAVASKGTPASQPPILGQNQNDGRRGTMTTTGTPTGQTATAAGAMRQATQNMNAQAGV